MRHTIPLLIASLVLAGESGGPRGGASAPTQPSSPSGPAASVGAGFQLPEGDAAAGREAFARLQCHVCHAVPAEDFPPPVASPPVPVALGAAQVAQPREALAESIIAPSHKMPADLPGATSGTLSRMGDYSRAMTVRELIDVVAYVQSLGRPATRPGGAAPAGG